MENITDKSIIYFKMPIIMNYCSNITLSSVCPHEGVRKEGRSNGGRGEGGNGKGVTHRYGLEELHIT